MKKISFLGLNLTNGNIKLIIRYFVKIIQNKKKCFVITLNSIMLFHYFFEKDFKETLQQADLIIPDSFGISFIAKLFGITIKHLPGIDLLHHLFIIANRNNFSIFLLGSKWKIIDKAFKNLKLQYPDINFTGRYYGYFNKKEEKYLIRKIQKLKPDILLVGMGSVRQEKWIYKNIEKLKTYLIIGVGGSFDIISGHKRRAPLWIRKIHLEWLYRSITAPSRFINIIKIFLLVLTIIVIKLKAHLLYLFSSHK